MKKHVLYIGLNDKNTKAQEIGTLDAFKTAANVFAEITGGATITEARGVYTHDDGTVVIENTLKCEIFGATLENVKKAAAVLKTVFNQESIALEIVETKSEFI